jgi:hypothetical protein
MKMDSYQYWQFKVDLPPIYGGPSIWWLILNYKGHILDQILSLYSNIKDMHCNIYANKNYATQNIFIFLQWGKHLLNNRRCTRTWIITYCNF